MEFVDAAVLAGYPVPATTMATTTSNTTADNTAPRSTPTAPAPTSTTQTDKLADTPAIDDEDLFLGDDSNDDNDEADNREEEEADEEDDDDFDEDYFSSTYRPLSNLPTPPPSSHTSSLAQSPYAGAYGPSSIAGAASADGSLLGPAVHLVNLLPPAASLATPSVALVQAMLARAQLPLDTVALAVCILDSLDSRFARSWRLTCPLTPPPTPSEPWTTSTSTLASPTPEKRHTLPSPLSPTFPTFAPPSDASSSRGLHIDAVFPEVIVLAALVIAAKFTDDGFVSQQPAQAYCTAWGASPMSSTTGSGPGPCALWTGAQLAATERCIMQNLGYRILPLMNADLLADAQADMRRAGAQALRARRASTTPSTTAAKRVPAKLKTAPAIMTPPEEVLVDGATSSAAVGLGLLQLTPPAVEQDESRDMVVDTSKIISLNFPSNMQRRHVSSRSESYGRYSIYDR
ncbi:hypothetical protein Sste5346_001578 [Sporothrix stenoceras]|uniref:Cyclin N-terminal domain-containing protein n=1 Tax=Sporothrix stenoceras TaxID=5173 RepID=A0ABR3ZNX4_9PEZI